MTRDVIWVIWTVVLYSSCRDIDDIDVFALLGFHCNMFVRVKVYRMEFVTLYSRPDLAHP